MPMHDWTRVEPGIFHAFHHRWISALSDVLNGGKLPPDYYALPEQVAAGFGFMAETAGEFHRRTKSSIVVRHVSGDRIVAMIEILSPGNKSNRHALQAFVDKACELLEHRIHLVIVDPFPPGPRDPNGIHAAIWEQVQDDPFQLPAKQPLTLVAYECNLSTHAYIEPVAVGQPLPDMPLLLEPNGYVMVPMEATCETAFSLMPRRWRTVLAPPTRP
jgi:hypothetical protein